MNSPRSYARVLSVALFFCSIPAVGGQPSDTAARIDSVMNLLARRHQFNGSVLVASHNAIMYRNGFGLADLSRRVPFTTDTPSYLASVSKQFTAMAVMILAARGDVRYTDSITRYFPELSPLADSVTVEHLLHHMSGLPDYYGLGINHPGITNQEVLDTLRQIAALRFSPGEQWEYSNSGYIVLSLLVERASGSSFAHFMKSNIFEPLGMSHTFVYDGTQSDMPERARGYTRFGRIDDYEYLTTGGGGIFSSANDLFRWDRALYSDKLLPRKTLARAFAPARLNSDSTVNYGFGWGIGTHNGGTVVSHSGGLVGYRTYITRGLADSSAIILLTNMSGNDIGLIAAAIRALLDGETCILPTPGIADTMEAILRHAGLEPAMQFYRSHRDEHDASFSYAESELRDLGSSLLQSNPSQAITILKLNTEAYPSSPDVFTTLASALTQRGFHDEARVNCEKALSLDPTYLPALALKRALNDH